MRFGKTSIKLSCSAAWMRCCQQITVTLQAETSCMAAKNQHVWLSPTSASWWRASAAKSSSSRPSTRMSILEAAGFWTRGSGASAWSFGPLATITALRGGCGHLSPAHAPLLGQEDCSECCHRASSIACLSLSEAQLEKSGSSLKLAA